MGGGGGGGRGQGEAEVENIAIGRTLRSTVGPDFFGSAN